MKSSQTVKPENAEFDPSFVTNWFCDLGWRGSLIDLPFRITEIGMMQKT